ncbi:MAG TPA: preprotein translocase subunit SecE [Planctomycetes bacterium]|nr:preprotein translocase subunit SecE [Planctomycetota bacterium]
MRTPIAGIRIPVISVDLSPAFLISSIVCVVGVYLIHRWQEKPKVADLLINTEAELRKVTWPTMEEVINSSLVVIVFVLFLGVFLAFADFLLARVVRVLLRV